MTGAPALTSRRMLRLMAAGLAFWCGTDVLAEQAVLRYDTIHHPVVGRHGMVVSQRAVASSIGADVLARGGNAVDAAVAVGFALAVALPRAGNIGGGGFMLVHDAASGATRAIDFRERAPAAAHTDMFLNADGDVDQHAYRYSHRAVGVPGTVAGLALAVERYGTLPLKTLIQPAIDLAVEGFVYDYDLASAIASRADHMMRHEHTRKTFLAADGKQLRPGNTFRQPELADSLRSIAKDGPAAFYRGRIAELIAAEMRRGDGLITMADLAAYEPVERDVVRGTFRGYAIRSMPPPSSGGVHVIQMLNMLERLPIDDHGPRSARSLHLLAEVMKLAYADRSRHMGDPDFYDVPVQWLVSKPYAHTLAAAIDPHQARAANDIAPGLAPSPESEDTTHFSVMDAAGNAVAVTYTLNFSFGSGITVPGGGFLLNNEMTDFSAKPGVPDAFGLLTGEANAVAPAKRPLSAMTPTMVFRDGQPVLVTGSPGGSRIISAVLQHIVNVLVHDMNVAEANHAPRIHHQWQPDKLFVEAGHSADSLALLRSFGHPVTPGGTMGSVQAIAYDGTLFYGSADPRRPGAGAVAAPAPTP